MGKSSGLGDNLYVGGVNVSGDIGSLSSIHGGPAALEVTGIDKLAFERLGGIRDSSIEFDCWFNNAAGGEHATLGPLPQSDVQVSYFRGTLVGNQAASLVARQVNYDWTRADDGSLKGSVACQGDGFGLEWGVQLTPGPVTDSAAGNGASIDTGASVSLGGQLYVHVFGVTGTSVTVKIQDSADNSSFSDVSGFTTGAFTTAGAVRVELGHTATLRRYLRAVSVGTFTAATYAVNVAKNAVAVSF